MSGSYPADTVKKWTQMRDAFDLDRSKPNPYEEADNRGCFLYKSLSAPNRFPDVTMAQLKLELLKEEARELSGHGPPPHKVSAGAFLRKAIDIEDRR
jgi:hypothetical protein